MATAVSIRKLRNLVAEPDESNGWPDGRLGEFLDDNGGDLEAAAAAVWTTKAATYASLVDVSEAGSSRKLSDLHKNALAMARQFAEDTPSAEAASHPIIRNIVRS